MTEIRMYFSQQKNRKQKKNLNENNKKRVKSKGKQPKNFFQKLISLKRAGKVAKP